jgi:drug/metabolite transporter (DMT)-like permease
MSRVQLKTRIVGAVVILSNVLGNYSLSLGLKRHGPLLSLSPLPFLEALLSPWVTLGVSLLILWLLSRMALLSWTDLSYVLPVTSIGYVLTAVVGRFFLAEQVSPLRWAGTLLIFAGVMLVGRTSPSTTIQEAKP